MKNIITLVFAILFFSGLYAQNYDKHFTPQRLRIDMFHIGTDTSEMYSVKKFIMEPMWSGPTKNISQAPTHGSYILKVFENETLIYQSAYNTLFEEWQDTELAPGNTQVFEESLFIPFPKSKISVEIYSHNEDLSLRKVWQKTIDPSSEIIETSTIKSINKQLSGKKHHNNALDIAIIAEGYTQEEMDKFEKDAQRVCDFFLKTTPFNQHKDDINFYAVMSPSKESGVDLPGIDIWKETAANCNFYTFGSERYLTTTSQHKCMDLVADIPHDQIIILANTDKYGGGGIFNHWAIGSADHYLSDIVLTHEFGHSFGGLGDEYYTSSTAYVKHPDMKHELIEPNVTNLVDFESKWKSQVEKNTPVPTPDIKEYDNTVGVFEGGRYLSKGVYRPYRNCRMKSNTAEFCPVCQSIIIDMINFYSNK